MKNSIYTEKLEEEFIIIIIINKWKQYIVKRKIETIEEIINGMYEYLIEIINDIQMITNEIPWEKEVEKSKPKNPRRFDGNK